jgi:hypothetical protein
MIAVEALLEGEYKPHWQQHCKNPSAWLMGIVSRALRESAG